MVEKTVEQRCYEALKARGVTFAPDRNLYTARLTDY